MAVKEQTRAIGDSGSSAPLVEDGDREVFGEFLASARRRAGRSIDDVAGSTKLSKRYLEALERGRVELLPPGMYRRAMLRSYAASVALDPQVALERFDRTFGAEAVPRDGRTPQRPQKAPPVSVFRQIAPLRPVAMSTLSAVPARAVPSLRAVPLLRLPPSRTLAAAVTIVLAGVIGAYVVAGRRQEVPQRLERAAPPSAGTGTSGRVAEASVESTVPAPVAIADPRLVVTSNPDGARVTVDGIGWGVTPLAISHLPPGDKIVRVTKDGYVAGERRVQLSGTEPSASVRLTLRRREQAPDLTLR